MSDPNNIMEILAPIKAPATPRPAQDKLPPTIVSLTGANNPDSITPHRGAFSLFLYARGKGKELFKACDICSFTSLVSLIKVKQFPGVHIKTLDFIGCG